MTLREELTKILVDNRLLSADIRLDDALDLLCALPASPPQTPGIPDHLQLNMAKVREAIDKLTKQHERDRAEIARLSAQVVEARAEVERMRTEVAMLRRLWEAARDWKRAADTPGVEVWRFTERLDSVIDQVTDAMSPRRG